MDTKRELEIETPEKVAFKLMEKAFEYLALCNSSRENSLSKTKLEEAMMWCNKDRTIKGELLRYTTHVEG